MIAAKDLPAGWRMLERSELPLSDKMPWWKENPLVLRGRDVKTLPLGNDSITASEVHGAFYAKGSCCVMLLCLTYPTPEAAQSDLRRMLKDYDRKNGRVGIANTRPDTIVFVLCDREVDSSARTFFVRHFERLAAACDPAEIPG
ncbi:MAG: hypothetical protein NT031_16535 [Planctomycetota bacterium]|nr:hypothetical protein [Planctomycetota bacterium]